MQRLRSQEHYKAALCVAREVAHKLVKDYGAGKVWEQFLDRNIKSC